MFSNNQRIQAEKKKLEFIVISYYLLSKGKEPFSKGKTLRNKKKGRDMNILNSQRNNLGLGFDNTNLIIEGT